MTTLATVLGILPIALALGAGAESRMSMGIAVIGGLRVRRRADAVRDPGDVRMLMRAARPKQVGWATVPASPSLRTVED